MFTEPLDKATLEKEEAFEELKNILDTRLTRRKELRILDFAEYPLPITSICDSMIEDLARVFEAGDARFDVSAPKEKGGQALESVLDELDLVAWVKNEGIKVLQSSPHTIVVIDKDEDGQPFLLPIYLDRLIDFKLKEDGCTFDYIMFQHSKDEEAERIAFYTNDAYIVAEKKKGDKEYSIIKNIAHDIGYCPARMFWDRKLNSVDPFLKKTPLVSSLGLLSIWTQFQVFKVYAEHTTPFPYIEMVKASCGKPNCENGYIVSYGQTTIVNGEPFTPTTSTVCADCESMNNISLGTTIRLPQRTSNDEATAAGVFRTISLDLNGVRYLSEMLKLTEKDIRSNVVGGVVDNTTEAVNEKQVQGNFERRTNVLSMLKNSLENLQYWIVQTLVNLVAKNAHVSISIDYGTQWYLLDSTQLQTMYASAIEKGLPREEIALIYYQMIETKYKNNPLLIQKLKLINLIDPCPFDNFDKKRLKLEVGLISLDDFKVSENIHALIERFESENGSIVEFGALNNEMSKYAKVESIKNILYSYINISTNNDEESKESNKAEPL